MQAAAGNVKKVALELGKFAIPSRVGGMPIDEPRGQRALLTALRAVHEELEGRWIARA